MFLAVDVGNTNIIVAIHDGREWKHKYRFDSNGIYPELFYETSLRDMFLEWGVSSEDITSAAISNVVPETLDRIVGAVSKNVRFMPLVLNPETFKQLNMEVPKIYEIGSDIVANAYACSKLYQKNTLIVDFGTALSITVYEHNKGITGVTIAPGLQMFISTLSKGTALLPTIEIEMPKSAIGTSTSEAISAGVLHGFHGMTKELVHKIKGELKEEYQIVATGALCTVIKELMPEYDVVNKNLTLEGILEISKDIDQ